MEGRLYFAYGSNINLDQMASRCPAAQVVGPVTLDNYELLFRGSGVATIAPKEGKKVHGLLWRITPDCETALNRYEGYPRLYDQQNVTVRDKNGEKLTVMAYVMTHERERGPALPPSFYYEGIREGYRQNGLPLRALTMALKHCQKEVDVEYRIPQHNALSSKKKGGRGHER